MVRGRRHHVDAPTVQWFANFVVAPEMFSAQPMQAPSLALPSGDASIAAVPVASVFSGSGGDWGGTGDGSFAVSELPFTHDVSFDDTRSIRLG